MAKKAAAKAPARAPARPAPRPVAKAPAKAAAKGGKKKTPQPPPPPPTYTNTPGPSDPGGAGYNLQYTPSIESQFNQPYQDVMAAGAYGALPGVIQNIGGQQQMGNMYGGMAQDQFGNWMGGTPAEMALTGQFGGQAGMTLGDYGQLLAPNLQNMQGIAKEIQDIQAGKADFDPFLTQQFNDQERTLRQTLARQLGPDYENSSAGIEALAKFNQNKTTSLGSAQFQRLGQLNDMLQGGIGNLANQAQGFGGQYGTMRGVQFNAADVLGQRYGQTAQDVYNQALGLRTGQLGGAGQMTQNTAALQDLYANVPKTMSQFGNQMTGQGAQTEQATGPYQSDRMAQLQASYAPTPGEKMGQYMAQSGDRWVKVGSSIGGMGSGASSAGSSAGSS